MTRAVVIGNATVYVIQRMGAPAIKQAAAAYAGAIAAAAAPEPPRCGAEFAFTKTSAQGSG